MELMWQQEHGNNDFISPSPHHYTLRLEINLGMTTKQFWGETQEHYLRDVFPPDVEVKTGEIIEMDDGLQPYYFYVKGFGTIIPLRFFQIRKDT